VLTAEVADGVGQAGRCARSPRATGTPFGAGRGWPEATVFLVAMSQAAGCPL